MLKIYILENNSQNWHIDFIVIRLVWTNWEMWQAGRAEENNVLEYLYWQQNSRSLSLYEKLMIWYSSLWNRITSILFSSLTKFGESACSLWSHYCTHKNWQGNILITGSWTCKYRMWWIDTLKNTLCSPTGEKTTVQPQRAWVKTTIYWSIQTVKLYSDGCFWE